MAIDLNDKTGNGNTLTNTSGVEYTADTPFAASTIAVDLESTIPAYLSASDSVSLSITGDLTIEISVRWESLPSDGNAMAFVSKHNGTGNQRGYQFRLINISGTYYLEGTISSDGIDVDLVRQSISAPPTDGTWQHYTMTVDVSAAVATEFEFFVNGSSVGNGSVILDGGETSIYDNTQDLRIGTDYGDSNLDGVVDEVRIWNDIRTSGEISGNYQNELVGNESNFAAYWPFELLESPSISPSQSQSPSSSASGSQSPSASQSPSGSTSSSESKSQSPSGSESKSQSPSASESKSQSPSGSLSPSASASPSESPSISPSPAEYVNKYTVYGSRNV